jgi:hypothetical protein
LQKAVTDKEEGALDVSTLVTGLYVVKFIFEDGTTVVKKFIKE